MCSCLFVIQRAIKLKKNLIVAISKHACKRWCIQRNAGSRISSSIQLKYKHGWLYLGNYSQESMQCFVFNPFSPVDQTKAPTLANSVDPDDTAHDEPSHQDLHCLQFCS